jgi:hypothetical protein
LVLKDHKGYRVNQDCLVKRVYRENKEYKVLSDLLVQLVRKESKVNAAKPVPWVHRD